MAETIKKSDVEQRVLSTMSEILALPASDIDLQGSFRDDLQLTSLDIMLLASTLGDEFGGSMHEEDWETLSTPKDVIDRIWYQLEATDTSSGKRVPSC